MEKNSIATQLQMIKKTVCDKGILGIIISEYKEIAFYVILFMLIHGEMVFNKLSWHDDIWFISHLAEDLDFGLIYGLNHGRTTLLFMSRLVEKIDGIGSLPVVHCLIAALCIAMIGRILIRIFQLKNKISKFAVMLICISLPAVTAHMGYMTQLGYNMIGLLLAAVAVYYAISFGSVFSAVLSGVLLALSIGEYQCYITFFLAGLLCAFIKRNAKREVTSKEMGISFFRYSMISFGGGVLYLVFLKICLSLYHTELLSYAGTDTYGMTTLSGYIERVKFAYKDFFNPIYDRYTMFPFRWGGWHIVLLVLLGIGLGICFFYTWRKRSVVAALILIAGTLAIPIVFNFNFILYDAEPVHALHQYQYVVLFAFLIFLFEQVPSRIYTIIVSCYVLFIGFLYVRYDNKCYMEAEMKQQQAMVYFSSLISDIHNTEGYYSEIPVCYVNEYEKRLPSNHDIMSDNGIVTNPYDSKETNMAMTHSWREFMYEWCGFQPASTLPPTLLSEEDQQKIEGMPRYPDLGSIKVIDGIMVVKF